MSTDEIQSQVIGSYLQKIAVALGLPDAPDYLDRTQVAEAAGLGGARSLAASLDRGVKKRHPTWVAFSLTIRKGAHSVPATDVARWMAIAAGKIAMPPAADHAEAPAPTPASVWGGLTHRCLGGG
jgi:hypothetical protein